MPDIPHMRVMTPVMNPSATNCTLALSKAKNEKGGKGRRAEGGGG